MCEACDVMIENGRLMNESQVASYVQEQVKHVMDLIPMFSRAARLEERNRIISIIREIEKNYPHRDFSPTEVIEIVEDKQKESYAYRWWE